MFPPHFLAIYAEHKANVRIDTGEILNGSLPRSAATMVKDWTLLHQASLMENWERARRNEPLERIPGLDADIDSED